ncbi:hypothetical protein ACFRMO_08035 [Streptomyces anulatus]|uniref:hypothetical protein n=1 Tax=Streptomyces anulatus TaxID=1892 RepID=UPI00368D4F60
MYLLRLPESFVPEDHAWVVRNPVVPHQQLQSAMRELHRFGFVSTNYVRTEAGSDDVAGLVITGFDSGARQYLCMYNPPFECRDRKVSGALLITEILGGVGQSDVSV